MAWVLLSATGGLAACHGREVTPAPLQNDQSGDKADAGYAVREIPADGGLPLLDIQCERYDPDRGILTASVGTAFVVRRLLPRQGVIALTAGHVAALLRACRAARIIVAPRLDSRRNDCDFELADPGAIRYPSTADQPVGFPLDIAALWLRPAEQSKTCNLPAAIAFRFTQLPTRDEELSTIRREQGGERVWEPQTSVTLSGRPDATPWVLGEMVQSQSTEVRFAGGYSGSPVLLSHPGAADEQVIGMLVQQIPMISDRSATASRTALAETLSDLSILPEQTIDQVFRLVPPSMIASRMLERVKNCSLRAGDIHLIAYGLDAFDQHAIIKALALMRCRDGAAGSALLRSMQTQNVGIKGNLPVFSLFPLGVSAAMAKNAQRCLAAKTYPADEQKENVTTLQGYAMMSAFGLSSDKELGPDQANEFLKEAAKCESRLSSFQSHPYLILQNLVTELETSQSPDPRSIAAYANIFSALATPPKDSSTPTRFNEDALDRSAVIAFRLFDLCHRTKGCGASDHQVSYQINALAGSGFATEALSHDVVAAKGMLPPTGPIMRRVLTQAGPYNWNALYELEGPEELLLSQIGRRVVEIKSLKPRTIRDTYH